MLKVVPCTHPALAPFVDGYFYCELHGLDTRLMLLPTGGVELVINLAEDEVRTYPEPDVATAQRIPGTVLQGAHTGPLIIDASVQRCLIKVGFKPGGAYPFFAVPASVTAGSLVDLRALWGRRGAVLRERLLEAPTIPDKLAVLESALLESIARPLEQDVALHAAAAALERGAPIARVAEHVGISPKQFVRRFSDRFGVTPKRFARIRRFQRVLAATTPDLPADWSELAVHLGYYDQSHLINEFRSLTGFNPTALLRNMRGARNHHLLIP